MTAHDHTEYVEGCFRCDLSRDETAPTGTEATTARIAEVLAEHEFLPGAAQAGSWYGYCRCSRWALTTSTGSDLDAEHRTHVAAVLSAGVIRDMQAAALAPVKAALMQGGQTAEIRWREAVRAIERIEEAPIA